MKKVLTIFSLITILSGCAIIQSTGLNETDPTVAAQRENIKKDFDTLPPPSSGKPISVAVYSFKDLTGQRKPQANIASLSSAVTQGAEAFLIKALQDVGNGRWFDVVERVGIDNLTKERLIIRQMREAYEGANAKPLMPMQFAGMIIEGGIVGYDSSINSGGAGMRVFGIGKQTQWTQDVVTVSLRAVSVNTGKVLVTVAVQKTILGSADSVSALKFYDMGTKAFEAETGLTINEPGTYAVKSATEAAVVELIKEGQRKGVWDFKPETPPPTPQVQSGSPAPVIASEIKTVSPQVKENKNELVQPQTPKASAAATTTTPAPVQPNIGKDTRRDNTESKPVVTKTEEPRPLFGQRRLKEAEFIYKEPNDKSQKTWQFKKGTVVDIRQPGSDGWVRVTDSEQRGGWIRVEQLEELGR
jgi:curli production assembly/transport component CsgG